MLENKAQNSSGKQALRSTKLHALSRVIKEGYLAYRKAGGKPPDSSVGMNAVATLVSELFGGSWLGWQPNPPKTSRRLRRYHGFSLMVG